MASSRQRNWHTILTGMILIGANLKKESETIARWYSTKVDLKKLRPMILKRIENRAKDYPIKAMVPVARDVLRSRLVLFHGVSILIKFFPIVTCKFCPEVYVGEKGHLIRTCSGYKRHLKNQVHQWIKGGVDDILVPVETFHLEKMFQDVIKHQQRFDFDRVPAVVELCRQAGADPHDPDLQPDSWTRLSSGDPVFVADVLSSDDLRSIAKETLGAWETLRSGMEKLLLAYPVKVCKYCSEVHVGPSGHKARLCGVFKYESWRGAHLWKKAEVDDLVPPKIIWHRRPQDPPVLLDEGRNFYGHAPAVVDLCARADVVVPSKYFCMMKVHGLAAPARVDLHS
ncbi:hypothetical protein Ancab_010930 [Ancistrocladus abbreviatus]